MPIVRLSNGKSFSALSDIPLLDAAGVAGLVLEHSCRSGRCRTCKAKVLAGTFAAVKDDLSLLPAERSAGWILTCATAATSDMQLDIEDVGLPDGIDVKTLPCRIDVLERLAPDVMKVVLRLPPKAEFVYVPGQYIEIIGKGGVRRSYSIANAPDRSGKLELEVRQIDGGVMSAYWFDQAKPNDLLRFEGPRGTFFLRDVAELDLVCLATGTGIAPIKAMLEALAGRPAADQPRSVSLYWGGRRPADHYRRPEFDSPAFRFIPVLSRADDAWPGARGHVQQVLLRQPPEWAKTVVYACGASAMIDSAAAALADAGLPSRRFFSDAFVSSN